MGIYRVEGLMENPFEVKMENEMVTGFILWMVYFQGLGRGAQSFCIWGLRVWCEDAGDTSSIGKGLGLRV